MKTKPITGIIAGIGLAVAVTLLATSSCTKTNTVTNTVTKTNTVIDSVIVNADLQHSVNNGTDIFHGLAYPFPPATTASIVADSGEMYLDQVHCNVMWETQYEGYGAMLTGRFNTFDIACNFDEANPANISVTAWVDLSSFNTGEPGRDAWGTRKNGATGPFVNGCGTGYMGLIFDSTAAAYPADVEYVRQTSDTARFVSTPGAVTKSGNIYLVPGKFTFRNDVNFPVVMKMGYYPIFTTTSVSAGKTYKQDRAGLYGEFTISQKNAGVNATNVADSVKIRANANYVSSKYTKAVNANR